MSDFVRENGLDEGSSRLQEALARFTDSLDLTLLDGRHIEGIVTNTAPTETVVEHKLNRVPRGWIITDRSTTGLIRRVSWDSVNLTLLASASFTISLWVF